MKRKQDRWRVEAGPDVSHEGKGGFDEIVVGDWLHIERMDRRVYWMRLGQREADIEIDHSGQPIVRWREP